ncbi:hypothetical protein, partial [Cereibacter sediminicola]|uniref:hypothetical protein n=1 Tax=Cereibacter sediminicola TaxID=2584941 RepID=UPI001C92E4EE
MPANLIHSVERYYPPPEVAREALIGRLEALIELDDELREAGYPKFDSKRLDLACLARATH